MPSFGLESQFVHVVSHFGNHAVAAECVVRLIHLHEVVVCIGGDLPQRHVLGVIVPTDDQISSKIESYGYQTSTQVEQTVTGKGYQTAGQVKATVEGYGYQTASQVNTAITGKGYQTSAQVQTAIKNAMAGIAGIGIQVVESLPGTGTNGVIYLVAHKHGDKDSYDEYVWVASTKTYEKIGNTDIDLSGYVQKAELTELTDRDLETMWGA